MGLLQNQRLILQVNQPQYPGRSRSYVQGFFMPAHQGCVRAHYYHQLADVLSSRSDVDCTAYLDLFP